MELPTRGSQGLEQGLIPQKMTLSGRTTAFAPDLVAGLNGKKRPSKILNLKNFLNPDQLLDGCDPIHTPF